ncbi:MAG: hypothetical protein ABGF52_09640 [Candidatus Asgardarchaeum sp.]
MSYEKVKTKREFVAEKKKEFGTHGETIKRWFSEYVYKEKERNMDEKKGGILSSMKYILSAGGLTASLTVVSQLLSYINALPNLQLIGPLTFSFPVAVVTTVTSLALVFIYSTSRK